MEKAGWMENKLRPHCTFPPCVDILIYADKLIYAYLDILIYADNAKLIYENIY